jgi:hypothetical protein
MIELCYFCLTGLSQENHTEVKKCKNIEPFFVHWFKLNQKIITFFNTKGFAVSEQIIIKNWKMSLGSCRPVFMQKKPHTITSATVVALPNLARKAFFQLLI